MPKMPHSPPVIDLSASFRSGGFTGDEDEGHSGRARLRQARSPLVPKIPARVGGRGRGALAAAAGCRMRPLDPAR